MSLWTDLIRQSISDDPPKAQVLGIGGSPRKGGNSDLLLKQIQKGVTQTGLRGDTLQLRDFQFQGCIGCEQCRKQKICTGLKDGFSLVYPAIRQSQGLVLACPTHNYNVTAWMKAFIDRLYCYYEFDDQRPRGWSSRLAGQGRKAVLCAVCEQVHPRDMGFTLEAMRLPLEALGYEIVGELPVLGIFDRAGVRNHPDILARAFALGSKLAQSLAS
ncbi:MAG: flavodoxin family protein [Desulfobacterales bacterium]